MTDASVTSSPHLRFDIPDFIRVIRAEAHRRDGTQKALVACGAATAEDQAARREIECLDAAALFLERLEPFIPDFREYLRGRRRSQGSR